MTDAASRGFLVLTCHLATPCYRRCIAWFPSVNMSFGYTLNFDFVNDAASRGFTVLACHWGAPCDRPDAASRGFLALASHLATPCYRRCIARFPSVSVSFGYTLSPTLHRVDSQCYHVIWLHLVTDAASRGFPALACHLATPCHRRCIAWFRSVNMSFGYTLSSTLHRVVS